MLSTIYFRFLRLYWNGDYTKERPQWLDKMSMEDILEEVRKKRIAKEEDVQDKRL